MDPESFFRPSNLGDHQKKMIDLIASDAEQLLERARFVTNGRYKSLFVTNFETAIMFLNKAIAFDGVHEEPVGEAEFGSKTQEPAEPSEQDPEKED